MRSGQCANSHAAGKRQSRTQTQVFPVLHCAVFAMPNDANDLQVHSMPQCSLASKLGHVGLPEEPQGEADKM